MTRMMREFTRPTIDVEGTDYGLRLLTLRRISEKHTHVRVTNLVFPYAFVIPMSSEMTITQWHVPIDDTSCYWYAIFTSFGKPVDHAQMREQRSSSTSSRTTVRASAAGTTTATTSPSRGRRPIPAWVSTSTSTTSGRSRSEGRIQDRSREHLGYSDKAISAYRRMLLSSIGQVANGGKPPMWLDADARRRSAGPSPSTAWGRRSAGRLLEGLRRPPPRATRAGRRRRPRLWWHSRCAP